MPLLLPSRGAAGFELYRHLQFLGLLLGVERETETQPSEVEAPAALHSA